MSIAFQTVSGRSTPSTIKIGSFPIENQTKKTKTWANDDDFQFFGFNTKADDSNYLFTSTEIVEYDRAKFVSNKETIEQSPGLIAAENENIQAS